MGKKNCDIILKAKYVLPMDDDYSVIENGFVVVSGNQIIYVGNDHAEVDRFVPDEMIDGGNSILMPGLINTHTHTAMAFFRGLADDEPLDTWLRDHVWPAEKNMSFQALFANQEHWLFWKC